MPYIGRNHIAGDHTSNFKVLDDISSYTATFDGSSTNVVSTANETLRILEHRFIQGQRVTYTNGGGGNIGGLTTGTAYFVTFDTHNTIKLATSLSNANNNININLSSVGSGTAHTLNAAFDGTNTKFKLTHNSGDDAIINNATQLQVAINNVIQRPNQTALSFTEGFAIEDNHKIVFKTAPTSNDVFWGSIIANTIESFDSSDFKVDNFTGDGSTTTFTLSKDVPNVQSLMVTLDGVTQHASDNTTTRSYSLLSGNTVEFTAPPGVGIEIQVKHLGFAGAATGEVSGFYGRTGNVTLSANDHITTGDITARNFKATGITTFSGDGTFGTINATTGTFSGNVSIGGTLTYEDVTNIDSVGIITARSSIYVADSIIHQGDTDTKFDFDNNRIKITVANTLLADYGLAGSNNFFRATNFVSNSSSPKNGTYIARFRDEEGDDMEVQFFNTNTKNSILTWNDYGNSTTAGNLVFKGIAGGSGLEHARFTGSGNFNLLRDLDVDGHTNLDNVSVAGVSTFSGDITVDSGTSSTIRVEADSGGEALFLATGGANAQATAAIELMQSSTSLQGGGMSYNGDGSPTWANGETADHITFYRRINGVRHEVFSYPYSSDNVVFNGTVTASSFSGSLGANNLTGTITSSVQSNITQLGTLGSLTVSGTVSPLNVTHTGGNCAQFNRSGKTVSINANYAAGNSFSDIGLTSGMDLKFSLGGTHKIVFKSAGHIEPETDSLINLGSNTKRFANVYADTLYGNGSNLTGIAADKIFEGNTEVETVDTGSDGHVKITTEGSERARITSAGKFLIGTSTPQGNANADDLVVSTSGHSGITIRSGTSSNGNIFFADGTSGGDEYRGVIDYNHSSNHMSFSTNAVERVRIDSSGNLMINSSSAEAKLDVVGGVAISSNGVPVSPSGYDLKIRSNTAKLGIHIDNASGTPILEFGIGGATGGRITTNTNAGPIIIAPNNVERLRIAADGQVLPGADDAQNLGSSTKRWKNIYAADMHFSNEGKTNDVDGTWGDWTLQEGEDSVFMINNRTGKKYAITMREVN
jgi:hypothetical protein